ncbi:MAG: DUF5615 family PIN-like protein [Candidatus Wallbacteria bacterium]|nr:DUF5615 family PIN-like protein [Candidatus Wallbacteria bacterium]
MLRKAGLDAVEVRDVGLRGSSDVITAAHAVAHGQVLISGDLDFANTLQFPVGSHPGIVVVRYPNETLASTLNEAICLTLTGLAEEELAGRLFILEPGRVRIRGGTPVGLPPATREQVLSQALFWRPALACLVAGRLAAGSRLSPSLEAQAPQSTIRYR